MAGKSEKPHRESMDRLAIGSGLTVRALEAFAAVARLGTMSAAAEHLGMTQSAVSQFIMQIEEALSVRLFDRTVRPPALTLQGAALLAPSRAIVNGVGQFQSALRWGATTPMPLLRIGMMNSFAETAGPAVLVRLRAIATQLVVDTGFGATRARAVADRETDLIITTDEAPPPPGIQALPLVSEPFLIVAPGSYEGGLDSLVPLSRALDLIRFGRDPYMNSRFDRSLRSWGVEPTHAYQMDTHAAVLEMVAAGVGWTILPPLAVHRALARGDAIKVAPVPAPVICRTISLISRIGEGAVLLADIHDAATNALRANYMQSIRALMPGVAELVTLHEMDAPAA